MADLRPGNTSPPSSALPSLNRSPKKNWVERRGGLPSYINRIARQMERKGHTRSRAIAMAITIVRNVAATGRPSPGRPKWGADVRAQAAKAYAQWQAMKASS